MVSRRLMFSSAVPKRVDIDAALKDIIGTKLCALLHKPFCGGKCLFKGAEGAGHAKAYSYAVK